MSRHYHPRRRAPRQAGAILAVLAVAALIAVAGCGKSSPKPAASGSGCAADATKNTDGGFCIKLPANQKLQHSGDLGDDRHEYLYGSDGVPASITVTVSKLGGGDDWNSEVAREDRESAASGNSQQQKSDLPGGGKSWSWVFEDGNTWITTLTHKDTTLFFCRTVGKPVDPAVADACKSVRPL